MASSQSGSELLSVDVTESPDLRNLAEVVRETGVGRILKRGDQPLAVLAPIEAQSAMVERPHRRQRGGNPADTILNIIGIGASAEPTDIEQHEREYLADAFIPRSR